MRASTDIGKEIESATFQNSQQKSPGPEGLI